VVLGHSYGGELAQSYALKYPQSLAGMVLVTSGLGFPDDHLGTRQYTRMTHDEMAEIQAIYGRFGRGEIEVNGDGSQIGTVFD
jgi:pimeloyl-ACP methyl ester carboxylesterase